MKIKVILTRVVDGKEERETVFLSGAAAEAVKQVHDREKKKRAGLERFFRHEWCPLFGVLPEPSEISVNAHRLTDCIEDARRFLGGRDLSLFDSMCAHEREMHGTWGDIGLVSPRRENYDPFCPSIDEIKEEILSVRRWLLDQELSGQPEDGQHPVTLKKIFGIDAAQILAARDFHKQSESRRDAAWEIAYERAHKLVYGRSTNGLKVTSLDEIRFSPKKKGTLHRSFDDSQVLAILTISLCYSALKKEFMKQCDAKEFLMGPRLLETIKDGHVRMSRKVVSPEDRSTKVGDVKKKKKAHKDNETKKAVARQRDRRLQGWANAIWEKDPSLSKASVADSIKKKHPKINLESGTIAKKIENN
jgi:hypothetical protein